MKKLLLILVLAMALCMPFMTQPAEAANVVLNLKAQWTANVETDMAGYRFAYFFGGLEKWWRGPNTFNDSPDDGGILLPLTPTNLLFTFTVASPPLTGTLTFDLFAEDTNANRSTKATATYVYNVDTTPPVTPVGFSILKQ